MKFFRASPLTLTALGLIAGNAMGQQGTFTDSGQSLAGNQTRGVAIGDVDRDGDLDAVVANWKSPNRVYLNDGNGNFADSGQLLGADEPSSCVLLGDFDQDGDLDVWIANNNSTANRVYLNDGTGTFSDSGLDIGSSSSSHAALGDLDNDGDLDVYVSNMTANHADRVWLNNGSGVFIDSGQALQIIATDSSQGVVLGDLDRDGDLDALMSRGWRNTIFWENDGTGTFSNSGQTLDGADGPIALGDVDRDGDLDAWFPRSEGGDVLMLNDGNGILTDSGQVLGDPKDYDSWTNSVALRDLDGDGALDAWAARYGRSVVWLNDGLGTFSGSDLTATEYNAYEVGIGDFDGDGRPDGFLAVNGPWNVGGPNEVWMGEQALAGDVDGDSDVDADDRTAVNDALGVCAADINGDGMVDGSDMAYILGYWGACSTP